jgi:N-methylhydantoinase A/oxoprolinase/acetone carboxylase beta subunit
VARSLGVPKVLIPIYPGNASALGMLLADLRVDKVWTKAFRSSRVDAEEVARQFAAIRRAAERELRDEGFTGIPEVAYSISMRYAGQNYEHDIPIPADAIDAGSLQAAFATFERIHAERYGYAIEGEEIELIAFHVTVRGRRPAPRLVARAENGAPAETASRAVYFRRHGHLPAPVLRRYALAAGDRIAGPCILLEPGSTTLVEPGMTATVLADGQLLIDVVPAES